MKIGIFLYYTICDDFAFLYRKEENIRETIQRYCIRHNVDDAIPVAFKGTDAHMMCKKFQYHFGRNEDTVKVRPLELCSRGLHFCGDLGSVFSYYPFRDCGWPGVNNRYFIALPEGRIRYGAFKMCSDILKILEEIPQYMTELYRELQTRPALPSTAMMYSGLYALVNAAVNEFIANNNDGNDYVNLIPYSEGGD